MTINKVGRVLKVRIPGDVRARLVTDVHRSGGNGRLKIRERVLLPRVLDLVYPVISFLESWGDISMIELTAIDFTDALHTIWLDEKERPLCVFESGGVYYVYPSLSFDLAITPLILFEAPPGEEATAAPRECREKGCSRTRRGLLPCLGRGVRCMSHAGSD